MIKIPVRAKIYQVADGRTALKAFANVDVGGIMYIGSYTVSNTADNPNRISAFPPSYRLKNGRYKPHIEFPHSIQNPLATAIFKACRSAYKQYEDDGRLHQYGKTFEAEIDNFPFLTKDFAKNISNPAESPYSPTDEEITKESLDNAIDNLRFE